MYEMSLCSERLLTENAAYPFCHANSRRCGNVSWTQRHELAFRALTRLPRDSRGPSETYRCTWSRTPPAQINKAPPVRAGVSGVGAGFRNRHGPARKGGDGEGRADR